MIEGSTAEATSTLNSAVCGSTGRGRDAAFVFRPDAAGTYCWNLLGSSYDTVAHVRAGACADVDAEIACNDDTQGRFGPLSAVAFEAGADTEYFLFVDGFVPNAGGAFRAELTAGPCDALLVGCDDDADCGQGDVCGPAALCEQGAATCAEPVLTSLGQVVGFTEAGPSAHEGSCGRDDSPEAVVQVSSPIDGTFCLSTRGSDFDTVLYVRAADCADGDAEVACNDDARALTGEPRTSAVTVDATAGTVYSVFVDGFNALEGSQSRRWQLEITTGACPTRCEADADCPLASQCDLGRGVCEPGCVDDARCPLGQGCFEGQCADLPGACGEPQFISAGERVEGTTVDAPSMLAASCGGRAAGPERVFRFEPIAAGPYCASLRGSAYDTVLHVQRGRCGAGDEVACNDDERIVTGETRGTSAVTLQAEDATPYSIIVDGFIEESGDFVLTLTEGACVVPECWVFTDCFGPLTCLNNECVLAIDDSTCANPVALPLDQLVVGTTVDADNQAEATCEPSATSPDHAFRFDPVTAGPHCFNLAGSAYDTVLHLRAGVCGDPDAEIACNDDAPTITGDRSSALTADLAVDTPYFVFVDGFGPASQGDYRLLVTEGACEPQP